MKCMQAKILREKCPNTEILWSVFSRILTEYGDLRKSPYSVQTRENTDYKKSLFAHFSRRERIR